MTLGLHSDGGAKEIILEVEDSERGIEPDRLNNIFDAFVTTKSKGTGVGLAICSRIIDRHSGRLTALSDGNGALLAHRQSISVRSQPDFNDIRVRSFILTGAPIKSTTYIR